MLLGRLPVELGESMHESCDTSEVTTEELLDVTVSDVSPGTILYVVTGEVDVLTGPALREKLTAVSGVPSHLVIDLSAVRFLASIGLNILVEILAAQEAAGRHLALVVDDNPAVSNALETTGLDQVFDLHAEVATAVSTCPTPTDARQQLQQPAASGQSATSHPVNGRPGGSA